MGVLRATFRGGASYVKCTDRGEGRGFSAQPGSMCRDVEEAYVYLNPTDDYTSPKTNVKLHGDGNDLKLIDARTATVKWFNCACHTHQQKSLDRLGTTDDAGDSCRKYPSALLSDSRWVMVNGLAHHAVTNSTYHGVRYRLTLEFVFDER